MILSLCVLTPNRIVWDSEVKEIILSTNSGQIGILPNHAPIATAVDIGILRIRLNDQWLTMALMGGFARIGNNEVTVLVNDAEKGSDIDPQEAQQTLLVVLSFSHQNLCFHLCLQTRYICLEQVKNLFFLSRQMMLNNKIQEHSQSP